MVPDSPDQELIYFRLTGPGRGAVAALAVHGAQIIDHLSRLFQPKSGKSLSQAWDLPIIYGNWITNHGLGEDVILCPINDFAVEIHCHGGEAAIAAITTSFNSNGVRPARENEIAAITEPGIWSFDNRQALAMAPTCRTAEILLNQYNSIDKRIQQLANLLRSEPLDALKQIERILLRTQFGLHLTQPWKVVLCGEPNVGKSSLINAIIGYERTIVHETAGTTRDIVSEITAVNGWPIELKDTAGLRRATDQIEEQGIHKAQREIEDADLVILVTDATAIANPSAAIDSRRSAIYVANKSDLLDEKLKTEYEQRLLLTSAVSGEGVASLIQSIENRLVPELPQVHELFPINQSQADCFLRIAKLIEHNEIQAAVDSLLSRVG